MGEYQGSKSYTECLYNIGESRYAGRWDYAICQKLNLIPNPSMRRTIILLFAVFFSSLFSYSQQPRIAAVLKATETKIPYYEMEEAGGWVLYLPMEYGKSTFSFVQETAIQRLKDAEIARVDLVYSDYPAGQDFTP